MHAWTLNPDESEAIIKHALDLRINFFDTANTYSAGTSEEYLGRAIQRNTARDQKIVKRVAELAEQKAATMAQIALAWQFAKGVASPIIGATKLPYLDDAAGSFGVKRSEENIAYLEEPYVPHICQKAIFRHNSGETGCARTLLKNYEGAVRRDILPRRTAPS